MEKNIWQKNKIKNIELKNRIVRSATNEHLGTSDGCITDEYIKVYENLAKNDVGLLITSHMAIDEHQKADKWQVCVHNEKNEKKFKELVESVHKYNSKIVVQISYPGHRGIKVKNQVTKVPSTIVDNTISMAKNDISIYIQNCVETIEYIRRLGFDGVQLHVAHEFLLSEFLDPFYNKREDDYGGTEFNRYRIIHEILENAKVCKNKDFLIMAKIDTVSRNKEKNFINQQIQVCKWMEEDGLDAVEISGANFKECKDTPYFLENALKIKNEINIPVILVGGFRDIEQMQHALNEGIDYVSMSRPFIAEENFVHKLKNNEKSICLNCNKCYEIYKTEYKRCVFREENLQLRENFQGK